MTLDLISIAYAKSSTSLERRVTSDLLAFGAELRELEADLLRKWRFLNAEKKKNAVRNPSSSESSKLMPLVSLTMAKRRSTPKDYVDLVELEEQEHERLRAECSLHEVVQSVLRSARWDYERISDYSASIPEPLQLLQGSLALKQQELVLTIETFLTQNAA